MALLEGNLENRLSFVELHKELSYGQPNGSPRRAINIFGSLFFLSVCLYPPVMEWVSKILLFVYLSEELKINTKSAQCTFHHSLCWALTNTICLP